MDGFFSLEGSLADEGTGPVASLTAHLASIGIKPPRVLPHTPVSFSASHSFASGSGSGARARLNFGEENGISEHTDGGAVDDTQEETNQILGSVSASAQAHARTSSAHGAKTQSHKSSASHSHSTTQADEAKALKKLHDKQKKAAKKAAKATKKAEKLKRKEM